MKKDIDEFVKKVAQLLPSLIREFNRRQTNELARGIITLPQMFVLDYLNKQGSCIMCELAKFLGITTSAVTGLVDRMIRADLLFREYDASDRRIIILKVSKKGEQIIYRINRQRVKMLRDIFSKLTDKDRQDYLRVLEKVYGLLIKDGSKL